MSPLTVRLPIDQNELRLYRIQEPRRFQTVPQFTSRKAYAAAHVVANPLAENESEDAIDWDATLKFRERLWSLGLGVAEAMDTAQRGMGLDWKAARELIRRSGTAAKVGNLPLVCGAGTDQLAAGKIYSLGEIIAAYQEQCSWIEDSGGKVVVMASRALTATARSLDDYQEVYSQVVRPCSGKVLLHWLGAMFDPALSGYWGAPDLDAATENFLTVLADLGPKVEGVKVSLLDKDREILLRQRMPGEVKVFTGDDFSYPELILGDKRGFSHALLGIFDGIAQAASAAFGALDRGNSEEFRQTLEPTVPLARHIFRAPTYYYKTGLVFLAYLNGLQNHFRMLAGLESARSVVHLSRLFILADEAALLADPELAVERMSAFLKLAGVE